MSFLNLYEKMQSFIHFGAEVNETIKATLATGENIIRFFNQTPTEVLPINLQIVAFSMLWANLWEIKDTTAIKKQLHQILEAYSSDKKIRERIDKLTEIDSFNKLLGVLKEEGPRIIKAVSQKYGN